jgi:urease accessory protein UreF
MSTPISDLGDLICQHLTFCYASGAKRELVKMSREMGATFEQIVAASLAQHIAERFEVIPKAEGNPPFEARTLVE